MKSTCLLCDIIIIITIIISNMSVINTSYTRCAFCYTRLFLLSGMNLFVFTSGRSESRSDSFIFLPKPKSRGGSKHLKHPESRRCFSPLGCSVLIPAALGTGCPPSLQNSSLHQCHHTKIRFAGKLRSRYSTSVLTHKQQAFKLKKKKKSQKF